jgi:hypothetical protein
MPDAGEKVRMGDKMRVERPFIDDLAPRDVDQDRVLLHQVQFARADQSLGGGRQRGADDEDIGDAQHLVEEFGRRDPVGRLVARAAAVDCVNFHPKGAHQPRRGDADIAEAEDATDAAAQHPVGAALVEFAALEVGVLDEPRRVGRRCLEISQTRGAPQLQPC